MSSTTFRILVAVVLIAHGIRRAVDLALLVSVIWLRWPAALAVR